jgi:RsiW-degrading membrane proteinase PrsW (M82 family)
LFAGDKEKSVLTATFLILAALMLGAYFLPAIIAINRNHQNRVAILVLNIFLGWTFLGWIVALVWSLTAVQPPVIVVQQPPHQ